MAVEIMESRENYHAVFYCNTTNWAFGPVMPSVEIAEAFLEYLAPVDPRALAAHELELKYLDFTRNTGGVA